LVEGGARGKGRFPAPKTSPKADACGKIREKELEARYGGKTKKVLWGF